MIPSLPPYPSPAKSKARTDPFEGDIADMVMLWNSEHDRDANRARALVMADANRNRAMGANTESVK